MEMVQQPCLEQDKTIIKPTMKEREKLVRNIMRKRLRLGARPSKELQEILVKMLNQRVEEGKPFLIIDRPMTEPLPDLVPLHVEPTYGQKHRDVLKVVAMKWKTRKLKYKGLCLESPIDIITEKVKNCKYYKRLNIEGLLDSDKITTMINAGVTVKAHLHGNAFLSDGPLFGKYKFVNYHIHFGNRMNNGSEHAINGKRFALELHIVFKPESCDGCPRKVIETQSSLAVLTLIFKESNQPCRYELFNFIDHIKENGKKVIVSNNLLCDFKHVLTSSDYYNYIGTITTVPFTPRVEWIIFKEFLPINRKQIDALQVIRKEVRIKSNALALRPVGERTVFGTVYKDHIDCRGKPVCECLRW